MVVVADPNFSAQSVLTPQSLSHKDDKDNCHKRVRQRLLKTGIFTFYYPAPFCEIFLRYLQLSLVPHVS